MDVVSLPTGLGSPGRVGGAHHSGIIFDFDQDNDSDFDPDSDLDPDSDPDSDSDPERSARPKAPNPFLTPDT